MAHLFEKHIFSQADKVIFFCLFSRNAITSLLIGFILVSPFFNSLIQVDYYLIPEFLAGLKHIYTISSKSLGMQIWLISILPTAAFVVIPWLRHFRSVNLRQSIVSSHNVLFSKREISLFKFFVWPVALMVLWLAAILMVTSEAYNKSFFGISQLNDYLIVVGTLVAIQIILLGNFLVCVKYSLLNQLRSKK